MSNQKLPHKGLKGVNNGLGEPITIAATAAAIGSLGKIGDIISNAIPGVAKFIGSIFGWECKWNASMCPEKADQLLAKLFSAYKENYHIDDITMLNSQENINNLNRMMLDVYSIRQHVNSWIPKREDETLRGGKHYIVQLKELEDKLIASYREYFKSLGNKMVASGTKSGKKSLTDLIKPSQENIQIKYPVYVVEGQNLLQTGRDWVESLLNEKERQEDLNDLYNDPKDTSDKYESINTIPTENNAGANTLIVGGLLAAATAAYLFKKSN